MNKDLRIGRKFLCLVIALVMVMTLIPRLPVSFAYAASGDEPDHAKILQVNKDGTYTLALNITGDAEKKPNPVNVIVIIDRSGSMDESTGNTEVTYSPTDSNGGQWYQNNLYGLIDGEYQQLTRTNTGNYWNPTYHFWYNGTEYTGQRYTRQTANQDRLEAAQDAANQLANALLAHNGQDGNADDTVEISLVSFSTHATTDVAPTTTYSTFETGVNALNHNGGTNWEAAFAEASDVDFNDDDPTYVVFLSDGLPTFRDSANGYTQDYRAQDGVYGDGQEGTQNVNRCYAPALTAAQSLLSNDAASNTAAERFYTIFAYGGDAGATRLRTLTTDAGAPEANNYSAQNTAQLQEAFAAILEAIEMAGIGNVDITDGTTSNVTTSSGTAHLLDVDDSSFKYYRAGGKNEDGSEKYDSDANKITDADGNVTNIGEEWTGDEVPEATFENGAVKWDLGEDFILENGVTYTVTFDCWPSQETLDHIASIKNDPNYYSTLDSEIQKYLDSSGNLKTNTSATLSYDDTRTTESEKDDPIGYTNPAPVPTSAVESLAVSKDWHNELEDNWNKPDSITLDVTRDGVNTYTAVLGNDNSWTDSVFISIGIMRTSGTGESETVELLTTGHNFTFAEPGSAAGYKWELDVPTVRPMKINGTDTILVLVDEDHPAPEGAKTYTIPAQDGVAGGTYYVDNALVSLTATNERRSSVNITKVVDGEDADPDQTFPFTIKVVNSLAPETAPSEEEDPNHDSDYWVWISVRDKDGNGITEGVGGATHSGSGWWYAPSGTDVTIPVKAGYSIRLNNLPVDSTYTITEGTLAEGYVFEKGEIAIIEGTGTKTDSFAVDTTAKKASGTIQETNTLYKVTMTNKYELRDITVTKVWDDADDQDGKRPEELELTLNGLPEGTTAPTPTITKSTDGNSWTYTWKAVPKYDSEGNELTYTVSENTVPEGYTKSPADPVSSGGTITNSYTPEVIKATVTKVWDDAENQDGIRPGSIVVVLSNGTEVTLPTAEGSWTAEVTGLPKYAAGQEIAYTWTEKAVPEGYTVSYGEEGAESAANGGTITNSHTPAQTEATVTKVWDDADNQDGKRPESLTVKLLADGTDTEKTVTLPAEDGSWTATITGLDKYAAGKEISYTWDEGDIEGYTLSKTEKNATVTTLTNTHAPEKVVVEVEKVWDDADNQDGIRPESVTVKLLADGTDTEKTVTLDEGSGWKGIFEDLDKYADGEEIEYTVEETEVPEDYEATVTPAEEGGEDSGEPVEEPTEEPSEEPAETPAAIGYIVTNVHEPEVVTIPVEKVWSDADDQDGFRPDSVTVSLLADGADTGKTVSLSEANEWKNTFEGADLYKYAVGKEGVEVVYTIKELEVAEYSVAITGTAAAGFTVTNTHTPEVTEVSVEKVWDDADDRDGIRPDSVTVTLKADGDDVTQEGITATVELNEKNNWKYTWEGLNKKAAGKDISYTVEEAPVPEEYEAEITGSAEEGYTIKNFHLADPVPVTIDPPVQKIVKGNPSTNETFTFQMKALTEGAPMPEGSENGVKTVQIKGSGSYEFGVAEITEAGTYKYEITELDTKAENYTYDTTVYTLTVEVEEVADGTQVKLVKTETVEGGNGTIVFTNTYEEPPVKTGDTTIVMPYIVIGISALILLLILLFRTRKNRA